MSLNLEMEMKLSVVRVSGSRPARALWIINVRAVTDLEATMTAVEETRRDGGYTTIVLVGLRREYRLPRNVHLTEEKFGRPVQETNINASSELVLSQGHNSVAVFEFMHNERQ